VGLHNECLKREEPRAAGKRFYSVDIASFTRWYSCCAIRTQGACLFSTVGCTQCDWQRAVWHVKYTGIQATKIRHLPLMASAQTILLTTERILKLFLSANYTWGEMHKKHLNFLRELACLGANARPQSTAATQDAASHVADIRFLSCCGCRFGKYTYIRFWGGGERQHDLTEGRSDVSRACRMV
jgi:hypothetical protein